jgi:lysozyme
VERPLHLARAMPHATRLASLALLAILSIACTAATGSRPGDDGAGQYDTESTRCAAGPTVEGVDVSYYEGHVDFAKVKASGRGFVIARISDGSFHDPDFATDWAAIQAAGLIRGAYQFFRPNEDPTMQANIVVAAVGMLGPGDLPVTADMEVTGSESASAIASRLNTWFDIVKAGTGKTPMVYTGKYFWRDDVGSNATFSSSALWIAQYGPTCPDIPSPWTNWKFFQYSDKGSVPGITGGVDVDKFNGSMADLVAFAGGDGGSSGGTSGGGSGGSSGGSSGGVCYSHTLGMEVPLDTCVQSKSDSKWYQCAGPNDWVDRWSDPAACASVHPL